LVSSEQALRACSELPQEALNALLQAAWARLPQLLKPVGSAEVQKAGLLQQLAAWQLLTPWLLLEQPGLLQPSLLLSALPSVSALHHHWPRQRPCKGCQRFAKISSAHGPDADRAMS